MFEAPERITDVITGFIEECRRTDSHRRRSTG
jgi:hypothetical protein